MLWWYYPVQPQPGPWGLDRPEALAYQPAVVGFLAVWAVAIYLLGLWR